MCKAYLVINEQGYNHVVEIILQYRTRDAEPDVEIDKQGFPEDKKMVLGVPDRSPLPLYPQ